MSLSARRRPAVDEETKRPRWRGVVSPGMAVAIPVLVFLVAVHVYSNELLLVDMAIYIALAQGINIIYGFTGYLPFGYFGFFGVGAYVAGYGIVHLGLSGPLAALLGGLGGVVVGAVMLPLFRLKGAYFALTTLAVGEALYAIVSNPSLTSVTNGPYGLNLAAVYSSGWSFGMAVGLAAISILAVVLIKNSRYGMTLRAIRDDPYSASMAGINVARDRFYAWLIAAAIAGVGGAIYGWAISVFYPQDVFDVTVSVFAIVFALFGGIGTIWGPTLGAAVLYAVYNVVGVSNPQYFQLIYGLVIVLLVLFAPRGLAGIARYLHEHRPFVRSST
ncbi:branched-chain amino acid ABC transporter permease [Ferrimicrobium sp.]|uniref:branched-chain amino acid ABC transporter permease n=1 Tax=Ferrimicrobium sp. TaxID=2926050 RepID=UPI0026337322|nr:branched-chain amino acid ABC transporter permease [Ferrimicrobium sp.]